MKIGSRGGGDGGDAFAPVVAGELNALAAARTQLVPVVWEGERAGQLHISETAAQNSTNKHAKSASVEGKGHEYEFKEREGTKELATESVLCLG